MKLIRPLHTSDSGIHHMVVEDCLAEPWHDMLRANHGNKILEEIEQLDVSEYWFDYGGLVKIDEPELVVKMDGCKYSVLYRFADSSFVSDLRNTKLRVKNEEDKRKAKAILGECVLFRGFMRHLILTPPTAARLADLFEQKIKDSQEDIEAAWNAYDKAMDNVNRDGLKVLPRNVNVQ